MVDGINPTGTNNPGLQGVDFSLQTSEQSPQGSSTNEAQDKDEMVPKTELDAAQQKIAALEKQLETLTNTLMNPEYLNILRGGAQPQAQQVAQPPEKEEEEEPNFEEMKPKEVVDYIVKKVTQAISPKIEEVSSTTDMMRAKQEIAECMAKYPDFMLYKDAMIQIGREKQAQGIEISAEDAYFIAKGRAQLALASKAQSAKPSTTSSTPPPKPKSVEKPGISPDATGKTSMSAKEAAERAFAQIFGS